MALVTGTLNDDLNLTGTSDADTINALAGNDTIIGFVGADIVNGGTGNDTIELTATSTDLNAAINTQIVGVEAVDGSGANDEITINLGLQTEGFIITGGAENDIITGGAGADTIDAGAGSDTINGFVGTDTINGGIDTDTLALTITSTTLNAASDAQLVSVEKVSAAGAAAGITLNLANQSESIEIIGSGFADTITVGSSDDKIRAGAGNDTINGFTTGDEVDGDDGSDSIVLTTLAAVAALNAADDSDIDDIEAVNAAGVGAAVTIDLSDQSEGFSITGTSAADNLIGGGGSDTLVGYVGGDILDGNGSGNDTIALTATSAALNTALNANIVEVEAVSAANAASSVTINLSLQTEGFSITGGNGSDIITGTASSDEIFGGAGNDTINNFTSNDEVDGGANVDKIVVTTLASIAALNGAEEGDIVNVEAVNAAGVGAAIDLDLGVQDEGFAITATGLADTIRGGEGADTILAGSGNDTIVRFEGADTIDGGAGIDTLELNSTSDGLNVATNSQLVGVEIVTAAGTSDGVTINLGLQSEGFTITGGSGNDRITGGAGADIINAGGGNDTINNFFGIDTVDGGGGFDTLALTATSTALNSADDAQLVNVERIDASDAAAGVLVSLVNQSEGFTIIGSDFADTITGTAAPNIIGARDGDDIINGFTLGDEVDGGNGNDTLMLKVFADAEAVNNAADDDISSVDAISAAGMSGGMILDLGDQSDGFRITGTASGDVITGSTGADTFLGYTAGDMIEGGAGFDTIALTATSSALNAASDLNINGFQKVSAANATSGVVINLINQAEGFEIFGGNGSDTITGTANEDQISTGAGNDTINGFTNDDDVDGGANIDKIVLTTQAHVAAVNAAEDDEIVNIEQLIASGVGSAVTLDLGDQSEGFSIAATGFADTIMGGDGNDTILAGSGNDTISGFVGADTVDGGSGIDTLVLTATSATLNAAINTQIVNLEAVNASGVSGGVTINLGLQTEGFSITGGSGDDAITGGAGVDNISAGGGNDTINGFVGADTVDGGADIDTLVLTATSTTLNAAADAQLVNVEMVDASGAAAGITLSLVNQTEGLQITGSDFADTITGTAAADVILAGDGNDTINGFTTGDEVDGEGGTDTLVVNTLAAVNALNAASDDDVDGIEAVSAAAASVPVTIDLSNQSEGFRITGGKSADTLIAGDSADTFVGFLGADTLDGNGGTDTLALTATSKTLSTATDLAVQEVEAISAATALKAVSISLALQTEGFTITGSNFADSITGGAGGDVISGGAGNDKINGGAGSDTLEFSAGDGQDTITGFVAGAATDDVIDLRSFTFADVSEVLALATDNGTDTVIDFGGGNRLTLLGVTEAQLHADDFLLS
jgi:Ca2+-binding RTX toxin-like protein